MNKLSDCWGTPQELFNKLDKEFNFSIDLCATEDNSKCKHYFTDYLKNTHKCVGWDYTAADTFAQLGGVNCFMNPPYSNPSPFVEKAWEDSKHCKIVCLLKCDPSTRWWATFWEYKAVCWFCAGEGYIEGYCECPVCHGRGMYNGPKPGCEVRMLPKRVKYVAPKGWEGKSTGPAFPSCIVIFDRR